MINNARAEADAMTGRGNDGKVIPSTERGEYDDGKRDSSLSDGEGSPFDDEMGTLKHQHGPADHRKRGSI
jgi:hypothetical protein